MVKAVKTVLSGYFLKKENKQHALPDQSCTLSSSVLTVDLSELTILYIDCKFVSEL